MAHNRRTRPHKVAGANQVAGAPARGEVGTPDKFGAHFRVDVLKSLGFDQCPRLSRIAHQLRGQQESGVAHLPARRDLHRGGPRLRQDRGQAAIPLAAGIAYIRKPTGNMIAYSPKILSDAELADIWAFLRTISDNPSPDSIPILNP